jgi:hypothetical protein
MKYIDIMNEDSIFKKVKKNIITTDSIKKENPILKDKVSNAFRQLREKITGKKYFITK